MNREVHSRKAALEAAKSKRSKKRAYALACVALAGVLAVGGTIAFITTKTGEIDNTFLPTSVSCEIVENDYGFVQGSTLKENVKVENTGTIDAFMRAEIVANWVKLDGDSVEGVLGVAPVSGVDYSLTLSDSLNWTSEMNDGYYYYLDKVAPDDFTDNLVASCTPLVAAPVDGYVLRVDVIAEAIQADGSNGTFAPVDSWDNESVNVTRSGDGATIAVANISLGA